MHPKIRQIRELKHSNLIELAEEYHNLVCEDGKECIIYEKKLPDVRVNLELTGGVFSFFNGKRFYSPHFISGVAVHIWLPRTSEKLFIKTGVNYALFENMIYKSNQIKKQIFPAINNNRYDYSNATIRNSDGMYEAIKIPLYFEYQYPKGVFRPTVAYGINYYPSLYPADLV